MRELRGRFRVREVADWEGLATILPSIHPTSVVVVDPYRGSDRPADAFWTTLERFPSAAVVPAFEVRPDRADHARGMVLAGVSEILNLSREHTPALAAARVRSAFARPFKRRIDGALSRHVAVEARTILTAAAEVAVRGGCANELADMFGVRGKTLASWCTAHGLPLPRRLLAWLRILLAAHLLEDAGRTRAAVAAACGYRTDRSLRRIIQRFVGPRSSSPLFESATRAFNDELRACRDDKRSTATPAHVANPMQDNEVQSYPAAAGGAL
ncbi:MAG TPA: helix-turn-helix domain-containing protein [Longimicrobium sp.]|nr:helix-turn-helix domain-containing protein [Longimicrobium sp.]